MNTDHFIGPYHRQRFSFIIGAGARFQSRSATSKKLRRFLLAARVLITITNIASRRITIFLNPHFRRWESRAISDVYCREPRAAKSLCKDWNCAVPQASIPGWVNNRDCNNRFFSGGCQIFWWDFTGKVRRKRGFGYRRKLRGWGLAFDSGHKSSEMFGFWISDRDLLIAIALHSTQHFF